jgi:hypothetical protein
MDELMPCILTTGFIDVGVEYLQEYIVREYVDGHA